MDDEDGYEWCELIFAVALEKFKPSEYEIDNKLRFFALVLKLFVEVYKEQAIIEVKTVNVKFKFRSKSYTFWVFWNTRLWRSRSLFDVFESSVEQIFDKIEKISSYKQSASLILLLLGIVRVINRKYELIPVKYR